MGRARWKVNYEEHKARHVKLHTMLDELLADFIGQTGKRPSTATCLELLQWSHEQTERPTEAGHNGVGESGHDYCEP
jgi:hypothetical protein